MIEDTPLTLHDYNDVVKLYHTESDRAAAILAASFLEEYMGHYLKSKLIFDPMVDELFENNGPLSSFDSRAKMLYALGLISKLSIDDTKYIRKIRNHFAHHPKETSFSTPRVKDWCSNLSTGKPENQYKPDEPLLGSPRHQYLVAIAIIIMEMHTSNINKIDFSRINGV